MRKRIIDLLPAIVLVCGLTACKKEAGSGGTNTIVGYVHTTEREFFTGDTLDQRNETEEDVYIIYGDDITFGDRTRTNYDGKFEFKYLREGDYKVYVYSDSASQDASSGAVIVHRLAVLKSTEIKGRKKTVDIGTFEKLDEHD